MSCENAILTENRAKDEAFGRQFMLKTLYLQMLHPLLDLYTRPIVRRVRTPVFQAGDTSTGSVQAKRNSSLEAASLC